MAENKVNFNSKIAVTSSFEANKANKAKKVINNNPWIKRVFSADAIAKREDLQKSAENKFERFFA